MYAVDDNNEDRGLIVRLKSMVQNIYRNSKKGWKDCRTVHGTGYLQINIVKVLSRKQRYCRFKLKQAFPVMDMDGTHFQ